MHTFSHNAGWEGGLSKSRAVSFLTKMATTETCTQDLDPPTHQNNASLCISHLCALFVTKMPLKLNSTKYSSVSNVECPLCSGGAPSQEQINSEGLHRQRPTMAAGCAPCMESKWTEKRAHSIRNGHCAKSASQKSSHRFRALS